MGFDFVNTRLYGATGPVSISSGSVTYQALNANVGPLASMTVLNVTSSISGTLIVRNGFVIGVTNLTSSNQPF